MTRYARTNIPAASGRGGSRGLRGSKTASLAGRESSPAGATSSKRPWEAAESSRATGRPGRDIPSAHPLDRGSSLAHSALFPLHSRTFLTCKETFTGPREGFMQHWRELTPHWSYGLRHWKSVMAHWSYGLHHWERVMTRWSYGLSHWESRTTHSSRFPNDAEAGLNHSSCGTNVS